MTRADSISGGAFLAVGLALVASGWTFPPGVGGLPGAGFFPQAIGGLMALLAVGLLLKGEGGGENRRPEMSGTRQVAGTAALLFAYLLLWGTGFFAVRTAVFLALLLRFLGQGWLSATGYSAALTAFVYLAFSMGLNVSLE